MLQTYGVDPEVGTLSPCKARPENRGRGRCFHEDHHDLDEATFTPAVVQKYNEEKLAAHHGVTTTLKAKPKPPVKSWGGRDLTRQEFTSGSQALAESFPQEEWETLHRFYRKYEARLQDEEVLKSHRNAASAIYSYLTSSDEDAQRVRAFLGPQVSLRTFSEILTTQVGRMTREEVFRNDGKGNPLGRLVLSSVSNDMTKERYVASVLFFGGRCCYCNNVLTRGQGVHQASAEHITPLNPKEPPPGATRYGNMALACIPCNKERKNEDLEEWVKGTERIPEEGKEAVLSRIKDFRNFALYREYSPEESAAIASTITFLEGEVSKHPQDAQGRRSWEAVKEIETTLKVALHDLRTHLR